MAISVDTIYQRVLAIANKEQRGYITPQEFNLFANQAQLEIFDQYFYDINQFGRLHGNDTEYSDMLNVINEKISPFAKNQQVVLSTNSPSYIASFGNNLVVNGDFSDGVNNWAITSAGGAQSAYNVGGVVGIQLDNTIDANTTSSTQAINTVAGTLYKVTATVNTSSITALSGLAALSFLTFGGVNSNTVAIGLGDTPLVLYFTAAAALTDLTLTSTMVGETDEFAVFSNVSVQEVTGRKLTIPTLSEVYRLGTVLYTDSTGRFVEVQRLLHNEAIYVNSSALTKPDETSPAYVEGGISTNIYGSNEVSLSIYPSSLTTGSISVNYLIKPPPVNWAYNIVNEKAIFNGSSATNFLLHASEEATLVNKILELSGIALQKPEVEKSALGRDNKNIQQEKS